METVITSIKQNKLLVLILCFGAILRFYHLDFQSAWLDELHTLNETNPSFKFMEVYQEVFKGEQMPVLYFYFIHIFLKLFGYSVLVARLFSVFLGITSIYATYLLGRELMNKKTGLIAAVLIAVNFFHLYYSQEARPYIFLYLFTTISFLSLIKFIKDSSLKNACLYGVITALMLYGHFFALFTIFAQYLFLMFVLSKTDHDKRKNFFLRVVLSGSIILVMHIPSIKILWNVSKISSFWVQMPTLDIYTTIFKGFFGNAEMLLFVVGLVGIFYFIKLFSNPEREENLQEIITNKMVFSFLLFSFWTVITLLIPLIRSHIKVPMIVDRYFIVLLPAVILIIAFGIEKINSSFVQKTIIILIIIFSLTDIVIVKKYYHIKSKSEFREISNLVVSNRTPDEPIYSNLSWYYSFYINKNKYPLVKSSLDELITSMSVSPEKVTSFWFVDGHVNTYQANSQTQAFLDKNFDLKEDMQLYGAWAKHYILKSSYKKVDISKDNSFKKQDGNNIIYGIDQYQVTPTDLIINGWALLENQDASFSKITLVLIDNNNQFIKLSNQQITRTDVTMSYKRVNNYDNSGFIVKAPTKDIPVGSYKIGIMVKNSKLNKEGIVILDQTFEK